MNKLSLFTLGMLGFGIPWSTALFRLSFPLIVLLLLGLMYSTREQTPQPIREAIGFVCKQPVVIWSGILVMWVLASIAWTSADMAYYKQDTWRYLKLLMVPVLAVLVRVTLPDRGRLLVAAYMAGVLTLMLPSALDWLGVFASLHMDASAIRNASYRVDSLAYFRNHIVHGFEVSVLAALAMLHALMYSKHRSMLTAVVVVAIVDVLFWTSGRMALISMASVLLFTFVGFAASQNKEANEARYNWQLRLMVLSALLLVGALLLSWGSVSARMQSIVHETQLFLNEGNYQTSAGARVYFWMISLSMLKGAWLLGAGAGGFSQYLETTKDFFFGQGFSHAHNEYLAILSQYGLIGFALFVGFVVSLFQMAARHQDRWLGKGMQCVLVVFLINALSDASLYNLWEGWSFVYFSAIVLGTCRVD